MVKKAGHNNEHGSTDSIKSHLHLEADGTANGTLRGLWLKDNISLDWVVFIFQNVVCMLIQRLLRYTVLAS